MVDLVAGFLADLAAGDPPFRGHPVRLVGGMLTGLERLFYPPKRRVLGGSLLVASALLCTAGATIPLALLSRPLVIAGLFNPLSAVLIYFLMCNRDMVKEARTIHRHLAAGRLAEARRALSRIVGRDTARLDAAAVIRATIESVAENIVDGFTAPFFYYLIGGVPGAYLYKTVNTIDSRFGYRSSRYEEFGRAGARLDDLLNYMPARLNALLLWCAALFDGRVLAAMIRYGRRHPSPNAGIAEAGFAGFLGVALGGAASYGGIQKRKPVLGEDRLSDQERRDPALILRAVGLYWRVVGVTLAVYCAGTALGLPLFLG
jgi:adenosylcobinamide-phosphate synthase